MIKDEFIEIKISKKNIKHFSSFYENIELKQIIKVSIEFILAIGVLILK